jgi:hypothetical protein
VRSGAIHGRGSDGRHRFADAALATVGVLPVAWWSALVVLAAVTSLVLLVLAFEPQLILGVGIDVVLIVVAVTGAWTPTVS